MTSSLLFLALAHLSPSATWTAPTSITIDGMETFASGALKPFRFVTTPDATAFVSMRGVGLWAGAVPRFEVSSSKGIYTWITQSKRVLALAAPSQRDFYAWAKPIRFPKGSIAQGKTPGWKAGKSETLIGRNCFVLDSNDSRQRLWVDQKLGITLRQHDKDANGKPTYDRAISHLYLDQPSPAGTFDLPNKAFIIWGIPDPGVMTTSKLSRPFSEFHRDLVEIRKNTKMSGDPWISQIPEVPGFGYVKTVHREWPGKTVSPVWSSNRAGAPEFESGALPNGWSANGHVADDGKSLQFIFADGKSQHEAQTEMPGIDQTSTFSISQMKYSAYLAHDGALVVTPGDAADAQLRRVEQGKANVVLQSDFISLDNGNSVSFLQVRGRSWRTAALFPRLSAPKTIAIGSAQGDAYESLDAFPLKLVTWKKHETTYLIASSSLSVEKLAELAARTRTVN